MGTMTATRMRKQRKTSWAKREDIKNLIERLVCASAGCSRNACHDHFSIAVLVGVSSGLQISLDSCTGLAATALRGGHLARPMYSKCRSRERVCGGLSPRER